MNDEIEKVPLLAYEMQAERCSRAVRALAIGWALTAAAFAAALIYLFH